MSAREYHEATVHGVELDFDEWVDPRDWDDIPTFFKEYEGVVPEPIPRDLERLLRLGAGPTGRTIEGPHGWTVHLRTYSSAGALYPIEVYVGNEDGVFHFHPLESTLRRLRPIDVRGALAPAEVVLVLTGIPWRTEWKYEARGYRHVLWDAGTMLANLLAVAHDEARNPHVVTSFVDDDVNRALGVDGKAELAVALLALGAATAVAPPPPLDAPVPASAPVSRNQTRYAEAEAAHEAGKLRDADAVGARVTAVAADALADRYETPLETLLRRRRSVRDFTAEPIPRRTFDGVLARTAAPIPADAPAVNELFVIVHAVEGVAPGAYRYDGDLSQITAGDLRAAARFLTLDQPLAELAGAVAFLMADLDAVLGRLGDRGYRWAQLESGIRAGRLQLGAFDEGLAATGSTFYDRAVSELFETNMSPMLCVAFGHKARRG